MIQEYKNTAYNLEIAQTLLEGNLPVQWTKTKSIHTWKVLISHFHLVLCLPWHHNIGTANEEACVRLCWLYLNWRFWRICHIEHEIRVHVNYHVLKGNQVCFMDSKILLLCTLCTFSGYKGVRFSFKSRQTYNMRRATLPCKWSHIIWPGLFSY